MSALDVVVSSRDCTFAFVLPQGQRLVVTSLAAGQLEKLMGQRFPLSDEVARKVKADQAHLETGRGWWCWLCYGCVGSTFDLDKDLGLLKREVLATISVHTLLQPSQFSLIEHVEEGRWSAGRVLLQLQLLPGVAPDPIVDQALPYEYVSPLKGTT